MAKVTPSCRVALKNDSYTLHKILPNKVDPLVSLMMVEKVPDSTYEMVGGLDKQIKEIKEVIELPVKHPELFDALGISQPKVCPSPSINRCSTVSPSSLRVCYSTVHPALEKPYWLEPLLTTRNAHLSVCRARSWCRSSSAKVHAWFENCSSWHGNHPKATLLDL